MYEFVVCDRTGLKVVGIVDLLNYKTGVGGGSDDGVLSYSVVVQYVINRDKYKKANSKQAGRQKKQKGRDLTGGWVGGGWRREGIDARMTIVDVKCTRCESSSFFC